MVHLFEVALKQGIRAFPPGVPTTLAPIALNVQSAPPPAMPAELEVPGGFTPFAWNTSWRGCPKAQKP